MLDPYGWYSQRPNNIGASVTNDKWAHGLASYTTSEEPPAPTDLNQGSVIGNTFIHVDRTRNGPHQIGLAPTSSGVHPIEYWYVTNNYGAAGAPRSDAYDVGSNQCQSFEGGTYCTNGSYGYPFSDVPITQWAHRYIGWAFNEGVISGYDDGTFRPNNLVSRQQFCKIAVLGLSIPINTSGGPHFSDVPTTSIFYNFIETAYNDGIISGYSDGTFDPGANITRGQMSKIVANAGIWKGWLSATHNGGGPDYYDQDTTFYYYIETLYDAGVIQYRREQDGGGNGGRFYPGSNATRAEAA